MNLCEDYVSFETARLLKEKGFDEEIETLITPSGMLYHSDENSVKREKHSTTCNSKINMYMDDVSCPTHQMVLKWLRNIYNILIIVDWTGYENEYTWSIQDMNSAMSWESDESYILYEHACEAAILFCLENLI